MRYHSISFNCLLLGLIVSLISCEEPPEETINENIIKIKDHLTDKIGGDYIMGIWFSGKIFSVVPVRYLRINDDFEVLLDSIIILEGPWLYIEGNTTGSKILLVRSNWADVSAGSLWEYDLEKNEIQLLRDSTYSVSSAVYFAADDNRCIYYSYGNPIGTNAGYFELDMTIGEDMLVFPFYSAIGPGEQINGFDLHHGGEILLIPVVKEAHIPLLVQYNMTTEALDTLGVDFDLSFDRICLWVRYNSSGDQILYSNYPRFVLVPGAAPNDDSEIGIIELPSLKKRLLDVNTNPGYRSLSVFPNWSPDDRHIVYGSGKLSVEGWRGANSLYILKNVN